MKENKKAKKVVALLLCAVLLVVGSVTGTMAYLTSQDKVVNTFTVGNVTITMDEAKTDVYGKADGTSREETGNEYKLIPGHTYKKDPTVYVGATSEESWLFVKVTNDITAIEKTATSIDKQMRPDTNPKWKLIEGTPAEGVYAYIDKVTAGDEIIVFNEFTIDETVNATTLASYSADKNITVQAYAVQAEGFTSAENAWNEAPTDWSF